MRIKRSFLVLGGVSAFVLTSVALAQGDGIKTVIGNVFLQDTTPGTPQVGHATLTGTFRAGQVVVTNSTVSTIPVIGNNTSAANGGIGGSFSAAGNGAIGLRGTATDSLAAVSRGVYGESRATNGYGVEGRGTTAVRGIGTNYGGDFSANVLGGAAVRGVAFGPANRGGDFSTVTASGIGVYGSSTDAFSVTNGGYFSAHSAIGHGVYGENAAATGIASGGYFVTQSTNGEALRAVSLATTGSTYALFAKVDSSAGTAVFASGKLFASGTKSFRIDHPSDPQNKYLIHYCSEGPEPLNIYSGIANTDANGFASVDLPSYYESINRDPRVQLTVDDSSSDFVSVKVVGGVVNGHFKIRTSKPNTKVYWEVKAVRNDLWVKANGAPVEVSKTGIEKGTYQHPELYGKPKSMGLGYVPEEAAGTSRP